MTEPDADSTSATRPVAPRPRGDTADARPNSPAWTTDAGLLAMVAIWAVNFSVIKVGLAEIPPFLFNALRFPLAALAVFVVLRSRGPIPRPERRDIPMIIGLGLVGNIVYQFFFITGMDLTRAGNASLLLATTPILTALLSVLLRHERGDPRLWAGTTATLAGMGVVVIGGSAGVGLGPDTLVGDLLMVGASVVWSLYTVGGRGPVRRYGSVAVTSWTLWIGTIGVVLVGVPDALSTDLGAISAGAWASVVYAGVLGIGVAYLLWYRGVRQIGSTRTAVYANLVPVLAILVAWAWLGETPTLAQIIGAAVIIGGISLARRR